MLKRIICAAVLLAALATAKTTVRDTLYFPNGTPATGRLTITWPSFTASGKTIVGGKMFVNISGGVLNIQLEPNDTAIPTGTSYTVEYSYTTGGQQLEYWVVPTSSTPVTVAAIRTSIIPAPNLQIVPGQIGQGGAGTGQCLAWSGSSWQPVNCNATQIQGRGITTTAPVDGQMLRWSASANQWQMVTLVDQATPTGTIDGTNTVFTLASTPSPATGLVLFRNGIVQSGGGFDYTLSGNAITFVSAATPQPGDVLLAWYRY